MLKVNLLLFFRDYALVKVLSPGALFDPRVMQPLVALKTHIDDTNRRTPEWGMVYDVPGS